MEQLQQTLSALDAAHKQQLLHRDVKPSNIWLEAPKGHVKLMDFGLCRPAEDLVHLTTPGTMIGTPLYLPPECLSGQFDERSDLYSLGVVLYETLTGEAPFAGSTIQETILKITSQTPKRPAELNEQIPQIVDELVMQMIEKEPSSRPASAIEAMKQFREVRAAVTASQGSATPD